MKYVVTVNGKKFEVEVEKVGGAGKSLSRQPVERAERREAGTEAFQGNENVIRHH